MKEKKSSGLMVAAAVVLVAALVVGIFFGRNFLITDNIIAEQGTGSETQEIVVPTDIYRLVKAWDSYMSADLKRAEVVLMLESKAFSLDEAVSVEAGNVNGKPFAYISKGALDAYIFDNTLYIEDDARFDIAGREFSVEDADIRQVLEFIYKLANNSEFTVDETEKGTEYRLSLTQQQIEELVGESLGKISEADISVKKGELVMTTKDNSLAGFDIICDGTVYILGFEAPVTLSVMVETSAENGIQIAVPDFLKDKIN